MLRRLHVPVLKPEDIKPHLADAKHWKPGYSAAELAYSWASAATDLPSSVRAVLAQAPEYRGVKLVDAFFEREVDLRSKGKNSQTDLMVVADLGQELAIIAVEGKVEESFNKLVREWKDSVGKEERLLGLCRTLNLTLEVAHDLRYQLLHRAVSALYEAERYHARHAVMLVHSFSQTHRWFEDFQTFASTLRMPVGEVNSCSEPRVFREINLRLGWVADHAYKAASNP